MARPCDHLLGHTKTSEEMLGTIGFLGLSSDALVGVFSFLLATDLTALRATSPRIAAPPLCRAAEIILEQVYRFKGRLPKDALAEPGRVLLALRTAELRFLCRVLCGPEPVTSATQMVSPPARLSSTPRRLFPDDDVASLHSTASSSDGQPVAPDVALLPPPPPASRSASTTPERRGSSLTRNDLVASGATTFFSSTGVTMSPPPGAYLPETPEAFWVSKNWIKNFLKFSECHEMRARALATAARKAHNVARQARKTPRVRKAGRHSGASATTDERLTRKERLRERRNSDVGAPWADANADIRCRHGRLALKASGRARRRAVDPGAWASLCLYFPASARSTFGTDAPECGLCLAQQERTGDDDGDHATMLTLMHRMYEIQSEQMSALLHRKKGFPPLAQRRQRSVGTSAAARCPLQPGVYAVLPRSWMLAWRRYLRDPRAPKPRGFELHASPLLCAAHQRIMTPPNLEAFLRGDVRTPMSGGPGVGGAEVDPAPGAFACEILAKDECAELLEWYPSTAVPSIEVRGGSWIWTGKIPGCHCCRAGWSVSMSDAVEHDSGMRNGRRSRVSSL